MLDHILPMVGACGVFVMGGLLFWPRGNADDQLRSQRLRGMAFSAGGIGFAPVIVATALDLPTFLFGAYVTLWLLAVPALFTASVVIDIRERREAHQRNAELAWPCGRPPRHPGWGFAAFMFWLTVWEVVKSNPAWIVKGAWLVVLLGCIGYTLLVAWRRLRWEYEAARPSR